MYLQKKAKKWSKNSRVATFGQFLDGHYNSVILHPVSQVSQSNCHPKERTPGAQTNAIVSG